MEVGTATLRPIAHGLLLRWMRKHKRKGGWLAERLDVSQTTVWRWVRGERIPETHFQMALEALTGGAVRQVDWLSEPQLRVALLGQTRELNRAMRNRSKLVRQLLAEEYVL